MKTITTIDVVTADSVSIKTQKTYIDELGRSYPVGELHGVGYRNSEKGRTLLQAEQPANIVASVLAMWGSAPTVADERIQ